MEHEFIFQRLIEIANRFEKKEVFLACAKFLYSCPLIDKNTFCLDDEQARQILDRLLILDKEEK